ncbi:MAG: sugar kinase [bacterium]|nr:sugar kinase [bacterium]
MERNELLVVGSMAYDDIETAETSGERLLGGSASHFSLAASLAGAVPSIVAVVGDDFAQADLDLLAALPADVDGVVRAPGKTFRWGGRYSKDFLARETLFTELGVFESFSPELSTAQLNSEIVFLANIHPALQREVLNSIASPRFTAMDTMNLWIDITRDDLIDVISRVDLLFINDEEARQLTGENSLVAAGKAILGLGPAHCMLKKGEHGVLLFSGGAVYPFPSFPVEKIVDPTGAGDSFAGGVMGRLACEGCCDTPALRRALLTGTVMGSFAVEGLGVAGLRHRRQLDVRKREEMLRDLLTAPDAD